MKFLQFISLIILMILIQPNAFALLGGSKLIGKTDLVRLDFKSGNMCTGAFIDSNTILTAAHCLMNNDVVDKVITENDQVINVQVLKTIIHPEFTHSFWPSNDIGIIKTTKLENFQHQFKLEKVQTFFKGDAIIYGCGISSFEPKARVRSFGKNSYIKLGSIYLFMGDPTIAPNDSGGLVVSEDNIIAIASKAKPSLAVSVQIESNFQFVKNNLGEMR